MEKKSTTIFLYLISLLIVAVFLFIVFKIEGDYEKQESQNVGKINYNTAHSNTSNESQEYQSSDKISENITSNEIQEYQSSDKKNNTVLSNLSNETQEEVIEPIIDNDILPTPDRIICKNSKNEYMIIHSYEEEYAKIYSELYNRVTNIIEGKIISEDEISNMQTRGSFIEFDYNKKSKNFVFMLNQEENGIIKRLSDSGKIIQTSLSDVEELNEYIDKISNKKIIYNFEKNRSYTSTTKVQSAPNDFQQKQEGIYQKIINFGETYKNTLELLNFKPVEELPKVDLSQQSVIITVSQYEITNIKENVGNVKYEFGAKYDNYIVNVLITSKVVNTNCIYYNIAD